VGNVTGSSQTTGNITYKFGYAYNLASQQTSDTYPSGRVLTTGYDAANRPIFRCWESLWTDNELRQ
jgi:YD repeat-containing protein